MNDNARQSALSDFRDWVAQYVSGDEKGEAQIFLERLFRAFGWPGLREAGASCELRLKNGRGGTSFADCVWRPVVLIEMKRRGVDLSRHYRQAFDYWTRLVPGRPRYVVLCNFDEFWIYDFETQMDTPVDVVRATDLPTRYAPLAFLFPTGEKPLFGNHQETVTRQAADKLATCFNSLTNRGIDRDLAQRFTLQVLVALFSEDIGLLDRYLFARLLEECKSPRASFDLIGGLFQAMNSAEPAVGGTFKGVPYFNGGLFAKPARVELAMDEISLLSEAARYDWARVRPEIFGTIFEHSLDHSQRHAFGAHFTSASDIMKIVGPTIVEPWRAQIESATTLNRLNELLLRIENFTVLDPACGSGNFLYIAYRELKRLEARINERMAQDYKSVNPQQRPFGFVTARNFFGIDINPFAVEIAKVTIMLAHKLAIDELHVRENALPLDNLDRNFAACDALVDAKGNVVKWPNVDVVIGNPPFLGAKRLKPERGSAYVNMVRKAYPGVPGMADYCVYWLHKTHRHLNACTARDPLTGRAGLVGTQNIRNNQSRVGGLDQIVMDGTIVEAVDNQPWSGEADVHVSIVNWVNTQDRRLLPKARTLWSTVSTRDTKTKRRVDFTVRQCAEINSALTCGPDVSARVPLDCNRYPKRCFQGKIPGYEGFMVDKDVKLRLGEESAAVVVPYLTGRELLANWKISRWAIDFQDRQINEAARFKRAFEYVQMHVLPEVQQKLEEAKRTGSDMVSAREEHLRRWWQFWNRRDELTQALRTLTRYIGCSRVSRRPIMVFLSPRICPSDLVQVFAFDDDYSFGILQSAAHFEWFKTSSRLKVESDLRYSVRDVFDTFPWPQSPTRESVMQVAFAAQRVRAVRAEMMIGISGGLREVYRLLEIPGDNALRAEHEKLDAAVRDCYGIASEASILESLLRLNAQLAEKIKRGDRVWGPGMPEEFRGIVPETTDYFE